MDDFIAEYNGKTVCDPWSGYCGECVSLWKRYAQEVQGVPPQDLFVPDGRAKNIWYQFTPNMAKYYVKANSPQRGDAAIYDGVYGDVAIVISPTQVFGQLGTPVFKPAAVRAIGSPLGYIRLKGGNMSDLAQLAEDRLSVIKEIAKVVSVDYRDGNDLPQVIGNIKQLYALIDEKDRRINELSASYKPYDGPPLFVAK